MSSPDTSLLVMVPSMSTTIIGVLTPHTKAKHSATSTLESLRYLPRGPVEMKKRQESSLEWAARRAAAVNYVRYLDNKTYTSSRGWMHVFCAAFAVVARGAALGSLQPRECLQAACGVFFITHAAQRSHYETLEIPPLRRRGAECEERSETLSPSKTAQVPPRAHFLGPRIESRKQYFAEA